MNQESLTARGRLFVCAADLCLGIIETDLSLMCSTVCRICKPAASYSLTLSVEPTIPMHKHIEQGFKTSIPVSLILCRQKGMLVLCLLIAPFLLEILHFLYLEKHSVQSFMALVT